MLRRLSIPLLASLLAGTLTSCAWFRARPPVYEPFRLESGVIVQDLVVPESERIAVPGDRVTICYTILLEDGTRVDSSLDRGQPIEFQLGAGDVPRGLDEGVVGMRLYGRRQLIVPPELAYSAEGMPPLIPPDATLRFEVELMGLEPPD